MPNTAEAFRIAYAHHQAGQLREAESIYRQILQSDPNHAESIHLLGVVAHQVGRQGEAVELISRAIALRDDEAAYHSNLGEVYRTLGRSTEAEQSLRRALQLDPNLPDAHNSLGNVLRSTVRADDAIAAYQEAIRLRPGFSEAYNNLGTVLHVQGNWAAAATAYEESLRLKPDYPEALVNLAALMRREDRLDEALVLCNRAIALKPDFALAFSTRAQVHQLKRRLEEAAADYQAALRLQPDNPQIYNDLGMLLNDMYRPDQAIECCRLGLEQAPASASLTANMGIALQGQGRLDEAIACIRNSMKLRPEGAAEHANLLYYMNAHPGYDQQTIFAEHLVWARRHAEPLTALATPHTNDRAPERRLRVGYVSAYFREHAVNYFTEPMIAAHDHGQFEIFCYSDARGADAATARLKAAADHWRDVRLQTDEQLARTVRDDAIDILVDLSGHIARNRLLTFARKPAPVQVTYIGYQNTTGMSAMDYRLTDERADPPGLTDPFYTERLVRLPRSFFCYRPADDPPVTELPAHLAGHVTFGSFNNYFKITPQVLDAWMNILVRVPRSRLLVLAYTGGYVEQNLTRLAGKHDIAPGRIEVCNKRPRAEFAQLIARADVALDPFPFNGHTTTCDSLWLGVPVVMLEGNTYASRFGSSALANVGLEELIARTCEQYVELAVELAGDLDRLARLRGELRARMVASPLLDFEGFTRHVEQAYRQMWRTWCAAT
jgi:predicted O-linked N-acetylglucosamine transferase (SPINDLY family)